MKLQVQVLCAGAGIISHVQVLCAGVMCRSHVQVLCAGLMCRSYVQVSCAGIVCRCCVQVLCAGVRSHTCTTPIEMQPRVVRRHPLWGGEGGGRGGHSEPLGYKYGGRGTF